MAKGSCSDKINKAPGSRSPDPMSLFMSSPFDCIIHLLGHGGGAGAPAPALSFLPFVIDLIFYPLDLFGDFVSSTFEVLSARVYSTTELAGETAGESYDAKACN